MEGNTKTAKQIILDVYGKDVSERKKKFLELVDFEMQIEAMEIYAEQESEKAVKEFKEMIIKELNYYGHPSALQIINDLIEKLK